MTRKMRRVVAALALAAAVLLTAAPALAVPECSPGQHGNPHPGFKPGVCG